MKTRVQPELPDEIVGGLVRGTLCVVEESFKGLPASQAQAKSSLGTT
jgi:hypothetical protein